MKLLSNRVWLVASLSALALVPAARAAIVVTNIPTSTSDFGYLNSALNPVLAIDLNGSNVGNTGIAETINGVNFTAGGLTKGAPGPTYAITNGTATDANVTGFNGTEASDPGVAKLLSDFFYPGDAGQNETLTISGLIPGKTYTLTLLSSGYAFNPDSMGSPSITSTGTNPSRSQNLTSSDGSTYSGYQEDNTMFSTVAYTSAAGLNGTLSLSGVAASGADGGLHLYGFTLVPEPASLGLAAFGALGLLSRRRPR